jgi:hypothetical protein
MAQAALMSGVLAITVASVTGTVSAVVHSPSGVSQVLASRQSSRPCSTQGNSTRLWTEAHKKTLITAQCQSPLWLNSGLAATEAARRAEHGVAVLLKSAPTASTDRPTPPTSASPTPSAPRTPNPNPATKETTTASRHPEMPGPRKETGQDG